MSEWYRDNQGRIYTTGPKERPWYRWQTDDGAWLQLEDTRPEGLTVIPSTETLSVLKDMDVSERRARRHEISELRIQLSQARLRIMELEAAAQHQPAAGEGTEE